MKITIEKMGINGEGIGYIEKKPTFVYGALAQEEVEIEVIDRQPRYNIAKLIKVIKKSKYRRESKCQYSYKCGGCPLMIMDYEEQLTQKKKMLDQALYKYAGIRSGQINDVVKNDTPLYYRNALKLPIGYAENKIACGMYAINSNHFINTNGCIVHEKQLEEMKSKIMAVLNKHELKSFDNKTQRGVRYLVLRGFDGIYQCTIITGKDQFTYEMVQDLMEIEGLNSLFQSWNTEKRNHEIFGKKITHISGAKTLEVKMDGYVFRLSPRSFFQLNKLQAANMYKKVREYVTNANFVVEAYSGIGAISVYCHDVVNSMVGIESIKDAVKNAQENARLNKADNLEFICGDAAVALKGVVQKNKVDAIVVDPPRTGLNEEMISALIKSRAKRIVYISCNPSTLAKNLADLMRTYDVVEITPYDMFSYTPLIETMVLLQRKK